MDDLGNIAYVLMAIGWFLFNAYKKSKQNKQKQPSQQRPQGPVAEEVRPEQETTPSLEDIILEQLGGQQEEPQPEPVVVHRNQDKFLNIDRTHSHLADDYTMGQDEMKSHRIQRQVKKMESEQEPSESLFEGLMPNGFDLKQAVVLNAILERPYK